MKDTYLAVDIGASSGRCIVGSAENKDIKIQETYRFENGLIEKNGHKCWDIERLKDSVIAGIAETVKKGFSPRSIGVDTWAVDFVLLDKNDQILGDAVSYRDSRTDGIKDELEENEILTFEELYRRNGIQYQKFNTIYQLMALKKEHPDYLNKAETFLMIPDYLNFVLTGVKVNEYTNATTTALVNAETKDWDWEIIDRLGLPKKMFQKIKMPGTSIGKLRTDIAEKTGADIEVILPATHDTGSAFLAVPVKNDTSVILSSGTWSLMGVINKKAITTDESREANFTNEGGYNYSYRYLKNIMGLWMNQNIRKELNPRPSFPELIAEAEKYSDIKTTVDVDDQRFLAPDSMIDEIKKACAEKGEPIPDEVGAVMQVVYNSLSDDYARTLRELERLTGKKYTDLYIVGGGCQDSYLNKLTGEKTGLTVHTGSIEATALGNLMAQCVTGDASH